MLVRYFALVQNVKLKTRNNAGFLFVSLLQLINFNIFQKKKFIY